MSTFPIGLGVEIRMIAAKEKFEEGVENRLLDIAYRVEVMEGNLRYLIEITAATGEEIGDLTRAPVYVVNRHHGIMETIDRMARAIPAWRILSPIDHSLKRIARASERLAARRKKKSQAGQ